MKLLNKILLAASSVAVTASLAATVLTSCSTSSIDDKLKVILDDNGNYANGFGYKDAVKNALSRADTWGQFKTALADEIVFKWFTDRMATSKDDTSKNTGFRTSYDEWEYQIKKDYEKLEQDCKNKYGNNYKFYLQNQYLSPYGGTEEKYKHAKLVEKVKTEFISKVFAFNYFSFKSNDKADQMYPHIFSEASENIGENDLNNPSNWKRLGFYARSNTSFSTKVPESRGAIDTNWLAKNPDGDYATIQNYVFNRWFATEKPFISAAALFKYSAPKFPEKKMKAIYNIKGGDVAVPDAPNEPFPFFGAYNREKDGAKGTVAYNDFLENLNTNGFETKYEQKDGQGATQLVSNGTITIPKNNTEDSQTLLLCFGSQMIGGASGALYIPYGTAASALYQQMLDPENKEIDYLTKLDQATLISNVEEDMNNITQKDPTAILKNFFYSVKPTASEDTTILDLEKLYGRVGEGEEPYHCPLFNKPTDGYDFFYGNDTTDGVKYAINTAIADLGQQGTTNTQPWIFELNEAGMHAQTIDGYQYVSKNGTTFAQKQEALKDVLKYRLMQKKCKYDHDNIISADIFGETGKLKAYFNDNFANIILEMAMHDDSSPAFKNDPINIFKPIETYKEETKAVTTDGSYFLNKICADAHFNATNIFDYIKLVITYERMKKDLDALETANDKIFAYRTTQVTNSKTSHTKAAIFANGLACPIPYSYEVGDDYAYDYVKVNGITTIDFRNEPVTRASIQLKLKAIRECNLISQDVEHANINDSANPFSPMIQDAKKAESNRFWYANAFVDKVMYAYSSNKTTIANQIKGEAFDKFISDKVTSKADVKVQFENKTFTNAYVPTYYQSKLFTGSVNYSHYGEKGDNKYQDQYIQNISDGWTTYINYQKAINGQYCDTNLNYLTFVATLVYLYENNFENFYKILNSKVAENESAFIGYLVKGSTASRTSKDQMVKPIKVFDDNDETYKNLYKWSADVNNIFDRTGYEGRGEGQETTADNTRIAADSYWHVINKHVGKAASNTNATLTGFLGLQTKSSNGLDSNSGLQAAAFDKLSSSISGSRVLTANAFEANERYAQNYGSWFKFAGSKDESGKEYTFNPVTSSDASKQPISPETFKDNKAVLKLAKKIAEYQTHDDLRNIAKQLGDAFYGSCTFAQIGSGEITYTNVNEMKYAMLDLLPKNSNDDTYKCFLRATDVELHKAGTDSDGTPKDYCFSDANGNAYKLLITQINKSDVIEKTLTPTWDKDGNKWVQSTTSTVTPEEFFYLLCNSAMDSATQSLAINEVVKNKYGDDKLKVNDAALYNCFDSVWIKDWTKKIIGE